jgi:methyl-accepting chemotaxis protein
VAAIVSEIAAASAEQAGGIDQVNRALTQMDEVTQQNSALVEENAATAKTLEQQSQAMDERVRFFTLDDGAAAVPAPVRVAPKAPAAAPARVAAKPAMPARRAPAPKPAVRGNGQAHGALAVATPDTDWKEF